MTLPLEDFQKIVSAQRSVLHMLGSPAEWRQAKPPQATVRCIVGMKTASWRDEELVNAYGLNARVFTIDAAEVAKVEKFDQVIVGNERYTLDAAVPVYINNELVFWKGIVRGD